MAEENYLQTANKNRYMRRALNVAITLLVIALGFVVIRMILGYPIKGLGFEINQPKEDQKKAVEIPQKTIAGTEINADKGPVILNQTTGKESPIMSGQGDYKPVKTSNYLEETGEPCIKNEDFIVRKNFFIQSFKNTGNAVARNLHVKSYVIYLDEKAKVKQVLNLGEYEEKNVGINEDIHIMNGRLILRDTSISDLKKLRFLILATYSYGKNKKDSIQLNQIYGRT